MSITLGNDAEILANAFLFRVRVSHQYSPTICIVRPQCKPSIFKNRSLNREKAEAHQRPSLLRCLEQQIDQLLEFCCAACFFDLLLDIFSFVFGCAFLDRPGRTIDNRFGFFQAKAGDRANNLDDVNFLLAA